MPRLKGSKNKEKPKTIDERIAAVTSEIESLQIQLKDKKAQLKELNAEKEAENQKRLFEAVLASGKSIDEIIAMVQEQQ